MDRTHRELTDEDVARIANIYHGWRAEESAGAYTDIPGFCRVRRGYTMIHVADVMTIVATVIQVCLYASGGYDGTP